MPAHTSSPGRLRYAASLVRLAARLALHPGTPLPTGRLNIPVPGPRAQRTANLDAIAARLGVTPVKGDGIILAERHVGCLTLEAHVLDDDYTRQLALRDMPDFGTLTDAARNWDTNNLPGRAA